MLPLVEAWFEQDLVPRLIVDENLAILHWNEAARAAIEHSPILTASGGQFDLADEQQSTGLHDYVSTGSRNGRFFFLVKQNDHAHALIQHQRLVTDDSLAYGLTVRLLAARRDDLTKAVLEQVGLTRTEARILIPLLDGRSAREIAFDQGRSAETVRTHVRNIYRKLGVNSRLDLLKVAGMLMR